MPQKAERRSQMVARIEPTNFSKTQIEDVAAQVAKDIGYSRTKDLSELLLGFGGRVYVKDFWQLDGTSDEFIVVQPDFNFFHFYSASHVAGAR